MLVKSLQCASPTSDARTRMSSASDCKHSDPIFRLRSEIRRLLKCVANILTLYCRVCNWIVDGEALSALQLLLT